MGLSRNKVAVSEGAAGSPPFYGESTLTNTRCQSSNTNLGRKSLFHCSILRDLSKREDGKDLTYGGVAQLGEHLPCKQGVMGSNPIISITHMGG